MERLTWKETLARLRADHARLVGLLGPRPNGKLVRAVFHPSFVCVTLYRVSNHMFRSGHWLSSRFFWQLNMFLTGADIGGPADIAEGFVILNPPGTAVAGKAGRNLTMMPCSGLGSELGRWQEIGAGPGLPVLGDDVILEPHSGVLGPVQIGHRVRIAAGITVTKSVPDDTVVENPPPRFLRRRDLGDK
jgi:serine O-acetyltransferase